MDINYKENEYELKEAIIKLKADIEYLKLLKDKKLYAESFATFQSKILDIYENIKNIFRGLSKSYLVSSKEFREKKAKLLEMNLRPEIKNVFAHEEYLTHNMKEYERHNILAYTKSNYDKIIKNLKRDEIKFNKIIADIRGYAHNDNGSDMWKVAEKLGADNAITYPKNELDTVVYLKKNIQEFINERMCANFLENKNLEGKSFKSIKPTELRFIDDDYASEKNVEVYRNTYDNLPENPFAILPMVFLDTLSNYENFFSVSLYLLDSADKIVSKELGFKEHLIKLNFNLTNKRMVGACKALTDASMDVIDKGKVKAISETDIDQVDLYKDKVMQMASKTLQLKFPIRTTKYIYGLLDFLESVHFYSLGASDVINFRLMEGKDSSLITVGPVKGLSEEVMENAHIVSSVFNGMYLVHLKVLLQNKDIDLDSIDKSIKRIQSDIENSIINNPLIKPKAYNARESYENKIIEIAYELVINATNLLTYEYYSMLVVSTVMRNIGHPVYDFIKRDIGAMSIALHKYALDINYRD